MCWMSCPCDTQRPCERLRIQFIPRPGSVKLSHHVSPFQVYERVQFEIHVDGQ